MAQGKITEAINWITQSVKKITGVDTAFGDPDSGVSSFPTIVITPEESGEVIKMASENYTSVIPLRFFIRVDKKQTLRAFEILEKILEGAEQLRPERGYTFGTDPETDGPARGVYIPLYDERGFFELGVNFKIQEIITKI